jgi:hypothetical protein
MATRSIGLVHLRRSCPRNGDRDLRDLGYVRGRPGGGPGRAGCPAGDRRRGRRGDPRPGDRAPPRFQGRPAGRLGAEPIEIGAASVPEQAVRADHRARAIILGTCPAVRGRRALAGTLVGAHLAGPLPGSPRGRSRQASIFKHASQDGRSRSQPLRERPAPQAPGLSRLPSTGRVVCDSRRAQAAAAGDIRGNPPARLCPARQGQSRPANNHMPDRAEKHRHLAPTKRTCK